jgi:8-oxo-dGTP pyrophosphatase MutT (NUDIX family)
MYDEQPKKVHRAGLVPYIIEDGEIKMMFMKPAPEVAEWSTDAFQLAKGKIEDGEDTMAAAIREAHEELGLFRGNIIKTEEVGVFMGRTTVFVSKVKDKDMFGLPSDETSEVAWMTRDEFLDEGRELHKPVIEACIRKICSIEKLPDPSRGVPINEVLDYTPEYVRYKSTSNMTSGYFNVEGHPYVASVEFGNTNGINFGDVLFAAEDSNGLPDYDIQNWETSPYKVLGGVMKVFDKIISDNPTIHVYLFGTDRSHGDVDKRMKLYNFVARRYAKQFGRVGESLPTKNGKCTVLYTNDLTPDEQNAVIQFIKTSYNSK